ncbi:hypothetical protein Ancab_014567 [Ancistrocladus abbreviatus]
MLKLKRFLTKLRRAMTLLQTMTVRPHEYMSEDEEEHVVETPRTTALMVPRGHFAVSAGDGEERRRFVVELKQLNNPAFLRLLEEAKEEFGGSFRQEGALLLPCPPQHLEKILEDD